MKEQTNYDYEKYVQIAQMAKMGSVSYTHLTLPTNSRV